jgi:hypothetical protein
MMAWSFNLLLIERKSPGNRASRIPERASDAGSAMLVRFRVPRSGPAVNPPGSPWRAVPEIHSYPSHN